MKIDPTRVCLDEMEIPVRATPRLMAAGIKTAADLDGLSDEQMLAIPGIGKKLLGDIRRAVVLICAESVH